jgi:hypothetical protein
MAVRFDIRGDDYEGWVVLKNGQRISPPERLPSEEAAIKWLEEFSGRTFSAL